MEKTPSGSYRRIVSLLPSLTEALFSLGLGDRVVGITDWCIHPEELLADLPKLGGTKTPDVSRILELSPDLIVANQEENRKSDIAKLRKSGCKVWVTYPRTVKEGGEVLRQLSELGASAKNIEAIVTPVTRAIAGAIRRRKDSADKKSSPRVFCPIWKDPWMSVGQDTYAQDLIELCGGMNVFSDLEGRRYPVVTFEQIISSQPDVILLPDEPYSFGPKDVVELSNLKLPASDKRIHCIDGTLISWYGPRIAKAIETVESIIIA